MHVCMNVCTVCVDGLRMYVSTLSIHQKLRLNTLHEKYGREWRAKHARYDLSTLAGKLRPRVFFFFQANCLFFFVMGLGSFLRKGRIFRGCIVNRTYGTHTRTHIFPYFYQQCLVLNINSNSTRVNQRRFTCNLLRFLLL